MNLLLGDIFILKKITFFQFLKAYYFLPFEIDAPVLGKEKQYCFQMTSYNSIIFLTFVLTLGERETVALSNDNIQHSNSSKVYWLLSKEKQ